MKSKIEIEKYKDELMDQLSEVMNNTKKVDDQFSYEIEKELQIIIETLEYVLKWVKKLKLRHVMLCGVEMNILLERYI